jgi:hypothetical protein
LAKELRKDLVDLQQADVFADACTRSGSELETQASVSVHYA